MIFSPRPRRREFTLRSRKKAAEGKRGGLNFRRPHRRLPARGANLLWLIILLILVIFLMRYFRSLNW
ncbi:MAG: hypothetical protein AMJ92_02955 [candidate division Zixibacteria bacterium SM23_81]|nr:MAG: hypothetical protein AMJ92_02955 [candidate division Zixibacteria bacterium SM23_81]